MATTKKKNGGFTLVEVLVVLGIFTLITAAIYGILAAGRRSWLVGEASLTTQQEARLGLDKITRELRPSTPARVTVAAGNNTVRFDIPIDADGDGFLDIIPGTSVIVYGADDLDDSDSDGALWEQGWQIEYQIDAVNGQIIRRVLDGAAAVVNQRIVVNNINPLLTNFQTDSGGTVPVEVVNINLTTEINTIQGRPINPPIQTTLRTTVNLRN